MAYGLDKSLQTMHTFAGTPFCMAPEILNEKEKLSYTKKVDVWSLGILVYFLCCGVYPFIGKEPKEIYKNIVENIQT